MASDVVVTQAAVGCNSPWLPKHIELFGKYVPSFRTYAEVRRFCSCNDLVFWAVLCGSFELAKVLWEHCENPLRTALISQHMCETISAEQKLLVKELERLKQYFGDQASFLAH